MICHQGVRADGDDSNSKAKDVASSDHRPSHHLTTVFCFTFVSTKMLNTPPPNPPGHCSLIRYLFSRHLFVRALILFISPGKTLTKLCLWPQFFLRMWRILRPRLDLQDLTRLFVLTISRPVLQSSWPATTYSDPGEEEEEEEKSISICKWYGTGRGWFIK